MKMKKHIVKYLLPLAVAVTACTESALQEDDRYGYLMVGVSDELKDVVQMKASSDEIIYRIDVYDADGNEAVTVEDHTVISEENPIRLLMGKYTVKATYGEEGSGFNNPCYGGENSVRIFAEKPASVDIKCKMKKVKFSVSFPEDEEFKNKFALYEVAVKAGEDVLTFSSAATEASATHGTFRDTAYFEVPADKILTYTLTIKNADGAQYNASNKIEQVAVAEHYHFDFTLGEREDIDGALVLNVILDGEYKESFEHAIMLNFDKLQMPTYSHNPEFDPVPADGAIPVYPLGNDITKQLTFNAPRGIKSLVISHLDANLLAEGLPQVTDLVAISDESHQILKDLGVVAESVTEGAVEASVDITDFVRNLPISPENEPYTMALTVIDKDNRYARCDFVFTIVSDIQAETVSAFPWSGFSILKGRFFSRTAPEGITFQYRKKSDTEWIEIDDEMDVDLTTLTYSYRLNHLEVNTEYVFRATSDKDKQDQKTAAEIEFRTFATEGVINNLSLDYWYKEGKAWYPNATDSSSDWVWDTANGGTATLGYYPTNPESSIVAVTGTDKKAAKMVSEYASVKFAAGNIYTGKFANIDMANLGAELDWGVPFTSRPLALKGYFRYEPALIDNVASGYESYKGKPDLCQIQIFLADWNSPFRIKANGKNPVFVDFTADYILAHGEIVTDKNTTLETDAVNGYIPFVIPLEYRTLKEPKYIVISAAASRFGDYFTGGVGSTLYLDELELVYDPDQLTDDQFKAVMKNIY